MSLDTDGSTRSGCPEEEEEARESPPPRPKRVREEHDFEECVHSPLSRSHLGVLTFTPLLTPLRNILLPIIEQTSSLHTHDEHGQKNAIHGVPLSSLISSGM
jgi:hypothetical protein